MDTLEQLITDRTSEDVTLGTAKGFYNASDLNRVESTVARLAALLRELPVILTAYGNELGIDWKQSRLGYDPKSLTLLTKTNWGMWDIPDAEDAGRYLGNIAALCGALRVDTKNLPFALNRLTWRGANVIEDCLRRVRETRTALEEQEKDRLDRTAKSWHMAGELFAGEENS